MWPFRNKKGQFLAKDSFQNFIRNTDEPWLADCIDKHGKFLPDALFLANDELHNYTNQEARDRIAGYYAEYISADIGLDKLGLLKALDDLPINVTIRKVSPRNGGNKWAVRYFTHRTYYGATLADALERMFRLDRTIGRRKK